MRVICEVMKLGAAEEVQAQKEALLQVAHVLADNKTLVANTAIRKLRTKAIARIVIRHLPAKIRRLHAKGNPK